MRHFVNTFPRKRKTHPGYFKYFFICCWFMYNKHTLEVFQSFHFVFISDKIMEVYFMLYVIFKIFKYFLEQLRNYTVFVAEKHEQCCNASVTSFDCDLRIKDECIFPLYMKNSKGANKYMSIHLYKLDGCTFFIGITCMILSKQKESVVQLYYNCLKYSRADLD